MNFGCIYFNSSSKPHTRKSNELKTSQSYDYWDLVVVKWKKRQPMFPNRAMCMILFTCINIVRHAAQRNQLPAIYRVSFSYTFWSTGQCGSTSNGRQESHHQIIDKLD
ncbi:hypothetical protein BgiMline_009869 [Biomphalaria glabrata]